MTNQSRKPPTVDFWPGAQPCPNTPADDLWGPGNPRIVQVPIHRDHRGSFTVLSEGDSARQTNLSVSHFNVIRGMHWQAGKAQITKVVRCIGGRIFDVVVDMRAGSKTFGGWQGFELVGGASNIEKIQDAVVVPKGFAHGFQVLSANATVLYEQDGVWSPEDERSVNPFDPDIGIQWRGFMQHSQLSAKDAAAPALSTFQ